MTKEEIKIISESMVESSKIGTANALGYIKAGLEASKDVRIPIMNRQGETVAIKQPYLTDGVRELVDFMIIWLDEAIKQVDESRESNKGEKND